jgi:signal transduction histidine kinase
LLTVSGAPAVQDPRFLPEVPDSRQDELHAVLVGIETSALELSNERDVTCNSQLELQAALLANDIRRLRMILDAGTPRANTFDLADAVKSLVAGANLSGLEVHSHVSPGIEVAGDLQATGAVLLALLENAWHHASGSAVELHATASRNAVVLHVEDHGPGIPGRLRARLFEAGVRGEDSSGSGHGLHTARRLMAEQGGSIAFRSRPGGGTTFSLRFRRDVGRGPAERGSRPRTCHIPR